MSFGKYILVNGKPVMELDTIRWAKWFEKASRNGDRIVKKTRVDDVTVSTVFLGLDHRFGSGVPILYETLIFGGNMDGDMERYATRTEAIRGHNALVKRIRSLTANEENL